MTKGNANDVCVAPSVGFPVGTNVLHVQYQFTSLPILSASFEITDTKYMRHSPQIRIKKKTKKEIFFCIYTVQVILIHYVSTWKLVSNKLLCRKLKKNEIFPMKCLNHAPNKIAHSNCIDANRRIIHPWM